MMFIFGLSLLLVLVMALIVWSSFTNDSIELSEKESDLIRRMIDRGQG